MVGKYDAWKVKNSEEGEISFHSQCNILRSKLYILKFALTLYDFKRSCIKKIFGKHCGKKRKCWKLVLVPTNPDGLTAAQKHVHTPN